MSTVLKSADSAIQSCRYITPIVTHIVNKIIYKKALYGTFFPHTISLYLGPLILGTFDLSGDLLNNDPDLHMTLTKSRKQVGKQTKTDTI